MDVRTASSSAALAAAAESGGCVPRREADAFLSAPTGMHSVAPIRKLDKYRTRRRRGGANFHRQTIMFTALNRAFVLGHKALGQLERHLAFSRLVAHQFAGAPPRCLAVLKAASVIA